MLSPKVYFLSCLFHRELLMLAAAVFRVKPDHLGVVPFTDAPGPADRVSAPSVLIDLATVFLDANMPSAMPVIRSDESDLAV